MLAAKRPPPVRAPSPPPAPGLKKREAAPDIDQTSKIAEPAPSNAITLPLDLSADAEAAARRELDQAENEKRRRNLAGPSESQLTWWKNNAPLVRGYHEPGDSEHAEGGELITWVNDKCFYTTHGITTFGMPETSKVCKDPPTPATDLFKDMRKKLDDSAKGRAP